MLQPAMQAPTPAPMCTDNRSVMPPLAAVVTAGQAAARPRRPNRNAANGEYAAEPLRDSEVRMVRELLPFLREFIPRGLPLVDLGPANDAAMRVATLPIVSAIAPEFYMPVDPNIARLAMAQRVMAEAHPTLPVVPIRADVRDALLLSEEDTRFVRVGGSSFSRVATPQAASPFDDYRQFMWRLRGLAGRGGFLMVSHQALEVPSAVVRRLVEETGFTLFVDARSHDGACVWLLQVPE